MSYEAPRHWRLQKIRYNLVGNVCPDCNHVMFPPRDICIDCGGLAKEKVEEVYSSLNVSLPTEVSTSSK